MTREPDAAETARQAAAAIRERRQSARQQMKARLEHDLTNHPPLTPGVHALLDDITDRCIELGYHLVDDVPPGREQSLAITHLEQVSMWAKAGIARNQDAA